jgi:PilZ domain
MQASDRRGAPRFRITIPLHFQVAKSGEPECHAETVDVSSRGALMETNTPPCLGAILVVRLRMPEMIMGWRVPEWNITCHVVHVEASAETGKYSVGLQFHYYEAAATHRGPLSAATGTAAVRMVAGS